MTATRYRWTMMGLSVALLVLGVVLLALLPVVLGDERRTDNADDRLFALPDWVLTNQHEQAISSESLQGRVWVADFIFTQCRGICPALAGEMAKLQERLAGSAAWKADHVNLVSFSVDPENDTPQALRAYGESHGADFDRWHFLTGERGYIWDLIENGFYLPVDDIPENELMPIMHSDRFVLVDESGWVVDTYRVLEPGEMDRLIADIERLTGP